MLAGMESGKHGIQSTTEHQNRIKENPPFWVGAVRSDLTGDCFWGAGMGVDPVFRIREAETPVMKILVAAESTL